MDSKGRKKANTYKLYSNLLKAKYNISPKKSSSAAFATRSVFPRYTLKIEKIANAINIIFILPKI